MSTHHIAIVGGGPWGTYALERLAALLPHTGLADPVHVTVFEQSGRFGAGATHSDDQVPTSYLNRVASQIAFAADESTAAASRLLPKGLRPTFAEWTRDAFALTGEAQYDIRPTDTPRRYLHGHALRDMFHRYAALLRAVPGVTVDLLAAEVTDLEPGGDHAAFLVHHSADGPPVRADHVLLVTGHSRNHPVPGSSTALLAANARYIRSAYPLADINLDTAPPGSSVGVLGLGLTSVDLLMHLTEGRGGEFATTGGGGPLDDLVYRPSGREPAVIVPVSPSGMFTWARAENAKAADETGRSHAGLEHSARFLIPDAIATLRLRAGTPRHLRDAEVRQLDFERHIFPLVVLEMAYVYYSTLFGAATGALLARAAEPRYRRFLQDADDTAHAAIAQLMEPVQREFERVAEYVAGSAAGLPATADADCYARTDAVEAFRCTVFGEPGEFGESGRGGRSPWGHPTDPRDHAFVWEEFFEPLGPKDTKDGDAWQRGLIDHMRRDCRAAAQGNLRNPAKAACDGVWRDLRSTFSAAIDFGGLTAASHRSFLTKHLRYYTRMSNGTGMEAMKKVLALIEAGVVDVTVGPAPVVEPTPDGGFLLRGTKTGAERTVDHLIEGKGHAFDAHHDVRPLYANLLRRNLVRTWRNTGDTPDEDFVPGAIDVTRDFRAVRADGTVESRITVLGAPVERLCFFQLSAARPYAGSSVLNNIAMWAEDLAARLKDDDIHD
ncbi:FAD/NAD(P)-binding protein [Streptacidiphilus sp. P02-A3a]|uniref:FAD/NAD(P)-binding protein n=1 Tax=Streptacidiphilus sp. P02-A3a TaxID=2704468 RepID=UPI0015FD275D|nr:FAD/NAD(P)-binding protein [Streptacidiphilus sp. P02-A3a]QMU71836.1 FAD/NAD(P)-binding protein [Streptacidiphilus sp. P02-A3a]